MNRKSGFRLTGFVLLMMMVMLNCKENSGMDENTFKEDVAFLRNYTDVLVLSGGEESAQVAVCPSLQGRIMTSTAGGPGGQSFGWINYAFFEAGKEDRHMNAYGGEDRLWLGPEGGQFSIFFESGTDMVFENWFTPPAFNSESWSLVENTDRSALLRKEMHLTNYSGTTFDLRIDRKIDMMKGSEVQNVLNLELPAGLKWVAYETANTMTNTGDKAWTRKTGALSIWMLDMLKNSPEATVVIPYKEGSEAELGPVATTNYFGEIPADRIKYDNGVLFFKVDGKMRGKLGLAWNRAKSIAGSYDPATRLLTLISFSMPEKETDYVNSLWEIQEHPFRGDALNSYNDGPLEDGSQMGPFYEIESSSPAAFLDPGQGITHYHRVFHFVGDEKDLDRITRETLGVGIDAIKAAF